MRCYRLRDASGAGAVVTAARDCPVPEIACPGRILHTRQAELLAHFAQPDASWADRILEPEDHERQAHGGPIPQFRQLPAPTSQPRPNPEQSPDITVRNPRHGLPARISATRDRIRTGGVIASVPTFSAETSFYRESRQYRQSTDHRQSANVPAASCTATATASLRAEPSITVTAIITARCRCFLNPTRT
jgi:hypothetical protein